MACHLASRYSHMFDTTVITNFVVECDSHVRDHFLHGCTLMFNDLVEICNILIRDNKWLTYTLHLSLKHTKYKFFVHTIGEAIPRQDVECPRLIFRFIYIYGSNQ